MPESLQFSLRKSEDRGQADHGWLKTFHTMSFSAYRDEKHIQYGPLRVINEDRVSPLTGFGTHPHREFEIFSYVVSGELEHLDSLGNTEVLKRGDIQLTSTGTGISHSEKTHGTQPVHFLQIWSIPTTSRLQPRYYTRHFTDDEKTDTWATVVAPVGSKGVISEREAAGPAPIQSQLTLYVSILTEGKSLSRKLEGKKAYVHVIQTSGYNPNEANGSSIRIRDGDALTAQVILKEGDGAYIMATMFGRPLEVENIGDRAAEFLVFDLD